MIPNLDTSEAQQATLLERMPLVIEMVTNVLLSAQKAVVGSNDTQTPETDLIFTPSTMLENQIMNDDPTAVHVEEADFKTDVSQFTTNLTARFFFNIPLYVCKCLFRLVFTC